MTRRLLALVIALVALVPGLSAGHVLSGNQHFGFITSVDTCPEATSWIGSSLNEHIGITGRILFQAHELWMNIDSDPELECAGSEDNPIDTELYFTWQWDRNAGSGNSWYDCINEPGVLSEDAIDYTSPVLPKYGTVCPADSYNPIGQTARVRVKARWFFPQADVSVTHYSQPHQIILL